VSDEPSPPEPSQRPARPDRIELRANLAVPILLGLFAVFPALGIVLAPVGAKIICGAFAAAFGFGAFATAKRKLVLDSGGIKRTNLLGEKSLSWDDVDHYTFWSMDQSAGYAAIGAGSADPVAIAAVAVLAIAVMAVGRKKQTDNRRFGTGRLRLVGKDGTSLLIDQRYRDARGALDRAFDELHPRLRAHAGDETFAPFRLTDNELVHDRKGPLALAEIERVSISGGRFTVKKRGKRFAWVACSMRRVANVMLLVEELADRGIVIKAAAGQFVPPTVLEKLRAAASRQALLPAARVVSKE
jgi:hypothetical protein